MTEVIVCLGKLSRGTRFHSTVWPSPVRGVHVDYCTSWQVFSNCCSDWDECCRQTKPMTLFCGLHQKYEPKQLPPLEEGMCRQHEGSHDDETTRRRSSRTVKEEGRTTNDERRTTNDERRTTNDEQPNTNTSHNGLTNKSPDACYSRLKVSVVLCSTSLSNVSTTTIPRSNRTSKHLFP